MPRNFNTQLAGQIGESLVVAELGRRGIVATAFAGNVPDIDLLAYRNGRTIALQVKSVRKVVLLCDRSTPNHGSDCDDNETKHFMIVLKRERERMFNLGDPQLLEVRASVRIP